MAILRNTLFAASVLASYAIAIPVAGIPKRELAMQTQTVTDWVTVNQQATVWVDDAGKPVKTDFPTMSGAVTVKPASSSSTPTAAPSSTWVAPSAPSAPAAVLVASSSTPVAASSPTYSPAGFAEQASSSSAPIPAWSSTPAAAAPTPTPSTADLTQKSSSGGTCVGQGSGCSGDITHYDGGLGACGWNVDTNSDYQIALPFELMGTQSNGNPYCGKSLTIQGPSGNQVQATVGDKCMGCTGFSIDLTNALFSAVAPSGDGRVSGITWWFN